MRYRGAVNPLTAVVLAISAAIPIQFALAVALPVGNLLKNSSFEERSDPAKESDPWGKGFLDGTTRSPFAHWGYSGFWDDGDYDIKLGPGRTGKLCAAWCAAKKAAAESARRPSACRRERSSSSRAGSRRLADEELKAEQPDRCRK